MKRRNAKRCRSAAPRRPSANKLLKWAAFGTAGLVANHATGETLITFGSFTSDNTPISSLPGYGDNVSANSSDYTVSPGLTGVIGTPDITIDWVGQWDTYTAWDGRGEVAQSDFNGGPASIVFNPSSSIAVRLESFDLDEWAGGGRGDISWSVVGATSGTLASGNWSMNNMGGRSLLSPNVTGLLGESLTLSLTLNSGEPSYFALDNLTFDQVPEPSTLALGALGAVALGAAAMRRRRRA